MRDRRAMLVTAAAVAMLTSACGGASTASTGTAETNASPISPAPMLPSRPREINLTGVKTCTLLTQEQQRRLGTDSAPVASVETDRYGNTYCDYGKNRSSPRFGYSVKVVIQEDATVYLTSERDAVARVVSAAGFPAVEARPPGDERGCFTFVSTKDGQYLSIQYAESTGSNDTTEVACEKARVAAEMAMQTLLTQR